MSLQKFNKPDVLTRARNGFSAVSCDVYIAKFSAGENAYSPWSNFLESFETLGVNSKGSPTWKDEAIIKEVDFEEQVKGFNCTGEIKLDEVSQELVDFIDLELKNQAVAMLFVPKFAEYGEKALLIENVKLTANDEGKANADDAGHTVTLKYKRRVSRLGDIYRILTIGEDVWNQYPIYGVMWDPTSEKYERLGSLAIYSPDAIVPESAMPIQKEMRRCVVDPNTGNVVYYLDEYDTTKKENGDSAVLDGTDGDVMVEIPAHYYREIVDENGVYWWWISKISKPGFTAVPKQYIGAYGAFNQAGVGLRSISGVLPTSSLTRDAFRQAGASLGDGKAFLWDELAWRTVCRLYLIEYASFNSQAKISEGNTKFATWDYSTCISQTGKSNILGNKSGGKSTAGGNKTDFVSYRGLEDLFGNLWQFLDGINIREREVFLATDAENYADDVFDGVYSSVGIMPSTSSTYMKKPIENTFIGGTTGGSSSAGLCDAQWNTTGDKVVLVGGSANNCLMAGVFAFYALNGAMCAASTIGGRLCRR